MLQQLVINFPSAKQDAIDLSRDFRRFVPNDALEISAGAIFESRNYLWMPQETFGRHDDQRLTPRAQHLAAQTMEILGRCGRVSHLQVVLGGEMKEALEAGAGMFRALSFVTVRQQQDQTAEPLPFVLGACDELI